MLRFLAPYIQSLLWNLQNCPQFYRWAKYLKEEGNSKDFHTMIFSRYFQLELWDRFGWILERVLFHADSDGIQFFWNFPIPWGTLPIDKIRKFYTFSEKSLKSTMKQWLKNLCDEISSFLDVRNRGLLIFETQWYFLRYCWLIKRI